MASCVASSKAAIDSASSAFDTWKRTPPEVKAEIFRAAAKLVSSEQYADEIVQMLVKETGWVVGYGKWMNVYYVQKLFLEAADMAYAPKGTVITSDFGAQSYVRKVPMGVM